MTTIIYSKSDYYEKYDTYKGYYSQFDTVKSLEVGESYVMMPNTWQQTIIKIVWVGEGVAVGIEVEGYNKGKKWMFNANGDSIGWRYEDGRYNYRLQELDRINKK